MAKENTKENKGKKGDYTADDIYILEGLEPVRKRPGMYIGSTGIDGLHHLVWEIFDNSATKRWAGIATSSIPRVVLGISGGLSYQDREKFLRQAERLKIRLEDCGAVGGEVLNEYAQAKQRDEGYEKELNDLAAAEKSLRGIMAELAGKIETDFFGGVEKINEEFRKFFVSVFGEEKRN